MIIHDFEYDPFQQESMKHIDANHSLVVSAPTGAGKTVIAEYVIDKCMKEGSGAIYTAPIKALSNQKYRDFCERYGAENVGIITGDVSINAYAPIVIMTTEIFRNALFDEKERFKEQNWVIFDEIHYIDDFERGTVWEESLMFFPAHMRMLCLSATIPNLTEFVSWISHVHNYPVQKVLEDHRPVPLQHAFQCRNYIGPSWKYLKQAVDEGFRNRKAVASPKSTPEYLIQHIKDKNHLPCIYFVFARRRCEELAQNISSIQFLTEEEQTKILEMYDRSLHKYNIEKERSAIKMRQLVAKGIAYHHAGMLPSLKDVIERLFNSRLIKMIFTTETFALGINMPARAVVFDELRKFYGVRFDNLRTRDYYQMAGRAGRRGLDDKGFVYSRIDPFRMRIGGVRRIIESDSEPVFSQFNSSYATLMHLYEKYQEKLYDIYVSSFHFFQSNKRERKSATNELKDKVSMLKDMGYISEHKLTPKGTFAASMYGYELMLGELFEMGVMEKLDEIELNIVLGSLIFEPRKRQICPDLTPSTRDLKKMIRNVTRKVNRAERNIGIESPVSQGYFHLSHVIEMWTRGESFENICEMSEIDEGEIVRNIRMVIQLLRLLINSPYMTPQFKEKARSCVQLINRDAVDAERQLRIT